MRAAGIAAIAAALLSVSAGAQPAGPAGPGDWPLWARDHSGQRFVPLDEINRSNVGRLERVYEYRLRPEGGGLVLAGTVPVVVRGIAYLPLGNAIVALEAHSGRELWRHEVAEGTPRRSVTWWPGNAAHGARLYYSTGTALVALDAATGQLVASFGEGGRMEFGGTPYSYPPSILGDVLVIGALTPEIPRGPSGNSRAFDAVTGARLWEFNVVPRPGEVGHETWLNEGWRDRPGANMWVWYTTADPEAGLIYMTLGSPGPNYWGGDRPGDNLFGNSLVALDARTGAYRWHFQTIHHDLWDYDLPAPPVLVDLTVAGRRIEALALTGKPGLMYILDRHTGEPVHGVNEMRVAAADVPGEWYSPTQPIPVRPQPLNRVHWTPADVVTAEDTSAQHAAACRALLDSYGGSFFNAGPFTPFFLHEDGMAPRASINLPHNGGSNWGGAAADPAGTIYINTTESGAIGWIERRDPDGNYGRGTAGSDQPYDRGSLAGPGAYASFSAPFEAADGRTTTLPCIRPPWGRLLAVDGNSGEIRWAVPLGTTPELGPQRGAATGSNNTFGGPMVTAGGLVFIGATSDGILRAFDASTGELVWSEQLDYPAMTVPISFEGADGRQYVAVVAAGSGFGAPVLGPDGRPANAESLIVWALPRE